MAKAIYICRRDQVFPDETKKQLASVCARLTPDHLSSVTSQVVVDGQIAYAVVNATNDLITAPGSHSLLLGFLFQQVADWAMPGTPAPDGTYGLFRQDAQTVEVLSDAVGSRTLWYYVDDELFVCATSQRAMVMFLGSFHFEPDVIPWMLSTGMTGPALAWDCRFRQLPGGAVLRLDREAWTVDVQTTPLQFEPAILPDDAHKQRLQAAIVDSVRELGRLDTSGWVLPLSGGYDSRGILSLYHQAANEFPFRTVTWGTMSGRQRSKTDGYIAKQLADWYGTDNIYYPTDTAASVEQVMRRFLQLGEGRVDHIAAYMDGFHMWKQLVDDGVTGIIRGDHGLGWYAFSSELGVRYGTGCALCSDYANLSTVIEDFDLSPQQLPPNLQRQPDETLATWTDRLYYSYRVPIMLAALSDLKLAYVEQVSPLLAGQVVAVSCQLPDHLRQDKALFKSIVKEVSPNIPYATVSGGMSAEQVLRKPAFVELLTERLRSEPARSVLPPDMLDMILSGVQIGTTDSTSKRGLQALLTGIKKRMPRVLKDRLKQNVAQPNVDGNVLALRAYLIVETVTLMQQDAVLLPVKTR